MADQTPCNDTGTCQSGSCSVCGAGFDCSRPSDCTVHRVTCDDAIFKCDDTGVARLGACERGKVCHAGSCVPCVVGAQCDTGTLCHIGLVTSCQDELICEPQPASGTACGTDAAGRTRYCVDGVCTTPCRDGECMSVSDPCKTSHWDCSNVAQEPLCVVVDSPEGSSCAAGSVCRSGDCRANALVNGDFSRGLEGWVTSGDGASFALKSDAALDGRTVLSTSPTHDAGGAATMGTIAQTFIVPIDAVALRFIISGGQASVRLSDAEATTLVEWTGVESNELHVPVSWELESQRGKTLTLSIVDNLGAGDWAYVNVSGFDVIREVDGPIKNPQWAEGFDGWETSGDGLYFNLFDDYNLYAVDKYGMRRSVSTYARAGTANLGDSTQGTVSQSFVVPMDATALRVNLCGGKESLLRLFDGASEIYRRSGLDSDVIKVAVSWDLVPYRGRTLRLVIEDAQTRAPYAYLGISGFDVITSYNGP